MDAEALNLKPTEAFGYSACTPICTIKDSNCDNEFDSSNIDISIGNAQSLIINTNKIANSRICYECVFSDPDSMPFNVVESNTHVSLVDISIGCYYPTD